MVQQYMSMLPRALGTLGQLLVSQKRLEDFLRLEEQPQLGVAGCVDRQDATAADGFGQLTISNASFSWDEAGRELLQNVSFEAGRGELVAVIGSVGSGKSSLLAAALGEMRRTGGTHTVRGTVTYCSQQPWLASGTLRDNVLFGAAFERDRYWSAIRASGLLPDLEQLPEGDRTAIGNRGINLSGGQKQRIALARAVYRQAKINILDDVLAAVDVHVGKLLLEQCICGAMAGTTRILVTNQLHVLRVCDNVYAMEDGKIVEHGTPRTLIEDPCSYVSNMMASAGHNDDHDGSETDSNKPTSIKLDLAAEELEKAASTAAKELAKEGKTAAADGVLVQAEERKKGAVMLSVYGRYLKFGASSTNLIILLTLLFGTELLNILSQLWVGRWAEAASVCIDLTDGVQCQQLMSHDTTYWTVIYASITISSVSVVFIRNYMWASNVVQAASQLHYRLLANVLRQPTSFFDLTPTGRILNRFASDVDMIDSTLSTIVRQPIEFMLRATMALAVTAFVVPVLLPPLLLLIFPYLKIRELFRRTDRELRRLDSTTRSPIFGGSQ
eukprot:SAG31_NODE_2699_length_5225_cov_2.190987_4_plen_556_part_00